MRRLRHDRCSGAPAGGLKATGQRATHDREQAQRRASDTPTERSGAPSNAAATMVPTSVACTEGRRWARRPSAGIQREGQSRPSRPPGQ